MADTETKKGTSFGRLFLTFLMLSLLALFVISLHTSDKLKESNEKALEQYLSAKLDPMVSSCFLHNYIRNSFKKIINNFKQKGIEPELLTKLVNDCYNKDGISLKAFFYNNKELKFHVNANEDDLDLLTDIMKQMSLNRNDEGYSEANKITLKKIIKVFGQGSRLQLIKIRKGFIGKYNKGQDKNQRFYWDTFDNNLGIFLYTTKVPITFNRFKNSISKIRDKKYGIIDSESKNAIPPEGFSEEQIIHASKITATSNKPFIVYNNHYCYFQNNRFEQKFCYVYPIKNRQTTNYDWIILLQNISAILFIITIILYITSLIKTFPGKNVIEFLDNLSIRYRIIGIFSMASIFPVLMTLIVGTSLITDKQSVIEENILSESLDIISTMAKQKDVLFDKTEKASNDLREAVKEAYLNNQPIDENLFYKYLDKYSIAHELGRFDVRDSNINNIFTMDNRSVDGGANLFDIIGRIVLKLHCPGRVNTQSLSISPGELVSESVLSTDELGFATIIRQRKKQLLYSVGAFPTTWYWDVYPDLATGPAFISISTQMIVTFSKQIENYICSLPFNPNNIQLAVFVNTPYFVPQLITPHKNLPLEDILDIANTSFDTNKVLFRTINVQGKPYWITAKHEKDNNSHVLINLVSQKERLAVLEPFKWQLVIIGVFALFISLFGAWFITRLIIIPIGDLSKGILAIRQRNKEFSIPVRRKDEFGELAIAFNKVISEFDELEYGKIIQESLLPAKEPEIPGYDIAYFTISATDLAGDYHDNVILEDGKLSIILGDVSGHGISASLAMAMAKATFNYAKAQKVKFPEEFMDMANTMFNKELKPRNKLMTLISMVLTPETGEVIFDNAGQSYPAYYTEETQTTEEIKMPSLPLGGMKKRKKKPISKTMNPGDAFIFYTDGIIEASAPDGEMFGYERFFAKFNEQMKSNVSAKEAIKNIYQAMDDFREAGPRSDDITLVIVRKVKDEAKRSLA